MKSVICICLAALVAVSFAEEKRCYSTDDCSEGYCCTGGIIPYLKGFCRKLAEENEICDPNPPTTGKYFLNCPCRENLKCIAGEIRCVQQ